MKKEAENKRVQITKEIGIAAKIMYDRGKKVKDIALALGPSESAISHLKTAGWDVDKYLEKKREDNLRAAEKRKTKKEEPKPEQLMGQIEMDLKAAEGEHKPEMSDQTKMMRFQAHQVDRIVEILEEILAELRKA